MAKTKEELAALKKEVKALDAKLAELTDDELNIVTGGITLPEIRPPEGSTGMQNDYEVSWGVEPGENHGTAPIEPGEYSVVITGKGNY